MTINSNEEYYPIGSQTFLNGPYYLVSCKSSEYEFACVAESDQNTIRISFPNYVACRITNSSFRDYDMRNRFCKHVIYEIKNSQYLEQVNSSNLNQKGKDYHHCLVSLDDTIIDVIAIGSVTISVSKCLDETGKDINDNNGNILHVEEIELLSGQSVPYENYDNFVFDKLQELSIPIVNFHEDYELSISNYGAIDLELIIESLKRNEGKRTIVFPEILCYKELFLPQRITESQTIGQGSSNLSFISEVQNSNFKEWLSYAGYRQLYGESINLRHIRVQLHNLVYDVLLNSKEILPYYVKG